jgi:16S rRNA (adenine1518-N6/adenine1519-N6)-dimethyltransferase
VAERMNVKALLRKHGLRPKKSWSQNFLVDLGVLQRIAAAADLDGVVPVVELGAGLGALTAMLAREASRVVAVERDRDLASVLRTEFLGDETVQVLEANAAKLDWAEVVKGLNRPPVVVGNLPYHMASQIIFHLLDAGPLLDRWLLMVQREMALRMAAVPGNKDWGVLGIQLQMRADVELVLNVPPEAFLPAPRVQSAVVLCRPLAQTRVPLRDPVLFKRMVKGVFSQRRKKIRNGLRAAFSSELSGDGIDDLFDRCGLDASRRPEQFDLAEFARLCDALGDALVESGPGEDQ